jgi:hypothetical protein
MGKVVTSQIRSPDSSRFPSSLIFVAPKRSARSFQAIGSGSVVWLLTNIIATTFKHATQIRSPAIDSCDSKRLLHSQCKTMSLLGLAKGMAFASFPCPTNGFVWQPIFSCTIVG